MIRPNQHHWFQAPKRVAFSRFAAIQFTVFLRRGAKGAAGSIGTRKNGAASWSWLLLAALPLSCATTSDNFLRLTTRPGRVDGAQGGEYVSTLGGMPALKTGGFIVGQGGGPGHTQGYGSGESRGDWTAIPTDGGYERIYNGESGFIAVKPTGELTCWGTTHAGVNGCPVAGCTAQTCTAAGVDAYYPKPISYIFSGVNAHCARGCHACSKTRLSLSCALSLS